MTFLTTPASATPEPATPKPTSILSSPIFKLFAYLFSWFLYSLSFVLIIYSILSATAVGGTCASGNTAFTIAVQCPDGATDFVPWVFFTGLIAVAIGVIFANGIGFQIRVWAWPLLFGIFGAGFLLSGQGIGYLLGGVFVIMALVPLLIELRGSVQRVFLGSFNIFGQQFKEAPNAQPSFSSRKMPNPPDAVRAGIGDWAVALVGFIIPTVAGYYVATLWVASIAASNG